MFEEITLGGSPPQSWLVRWDNLTYFYIPRLVHNGQFLVGVSPNSVVVPPDTARDVVFLESGYLQLLWVGGAPLLGGFIALSGIRGFCAGAAQPLPLGGMVAAVSAPVLPESSLKLLRCQQSLSPLELRDDGLLSPESGITYPVKDGLIFMGYDQARDEMTIARR
jgi:hypothetical protein